MSCMSYHWEPYWMLPVQVQLLCIATPAEVVTGGMCCMQPCQCHSVRVC